MKARIPSGNRQRSKNQLLVDAASKRARALHDEGRFAEALAICLQIARAHPHLDGPWIDAAANCVKLERWDEAIRCAQSALACGGDTLSLYDALSHAHSALQQWDAVRRYGLHALTMRDRRFGIEPTLPHASPDALPPPPCPATRDRNIISFSLFGGNSKYSEPAVLNALEQPRLYPHWTCRFYLDDSVPAVTVRRLAEAGAEIVTIDGESAHWPGPMWRFLALDDPRIHRVLFRDADSVISEREALAVDEWLHSDKRFHAMRDHGSHTELLLAGLWGAVGGSLPPIGELVRRFVARPPGSARFADQFFLRQYVWPYARRSLLQHDSKFGFLDARPFPGSAPSERFHVGYSEGSPRFSTRSTLPDGTEVMWQLVRSDSQLVCAYPARVEAGTVSAHLPARYARWIEDGSATIRIVASENTRP
ncbi:hypothetical protein ACDA63_10715 [Uliginosibacterium sp. sgz301328]|uniref:hypothetical protein n=1 Tax=Uliginosibacterium sp. sgz301328 TaxID=3243764 RepID=UPI00359E4E1C